MTAARFRSCFFPHPSATRQHGNRLKDVTMAPHTASSRSASPARRWLTGVAAMATTALATGCMKELLFLGLLIGGFPSIEPDFDSKLGLSMTDKDVVVAVVCYAPTELKFDFDELDHEIARTVTFRMHQHGIKVISPDQIRAWLDENPDWDKPSEIGEAFDATYVVYIDMLKYSLYEKGSASLYRGRSEAFVSVIQMDDEGEGEKIYSKEVLSQYPLAAPRPASEVTYSTFKKQYLSRLSEEIGRLFYEHYNGDDMGDAV